ncbi:MAG: LysE family translocator [bacterium]|nr:LysE family translocator [bacterium]
MSLEAWAAFCVTETVLCFTPGPAVLLVVSVALGRGFRSSTGAAFGIIAANSLYFALSATGVAAALIASRELFLALKWVGAAYLVWLGLRMMLSGSSAGHDESPAPAARTFIRGFVVQGANPKALVFFVALLPQFIDPSGSVPTQLFVLGVSSILIEFVALASYAFAAVRSRRVAGVRIAGALQRVGGGLLVAAGARLAAVRSE